MKMLKIITHPIGLLLSVVSLGVAGAFTLEVMIRLSESMLAMSVPGMSPIIQTDWPRSLSRILWSMMLSTVCMKIVVVVLDLVRFSHGRRIVDMTPLDQIDVLEHEFLLRWSMRDDDDDVTSVWEAIP